MGKRIIEFILHNKARFISIAALVVFGAVLLIFARIGSRRADPNYGIKEEYQEQTENEELRTLIESYYKAYAAGDVDALEKLASPLSDMEKSHIKFMSEYIESYDIDSIYSKRGEDSSTYFLSVEIAIKYKDVESKAPGLDFFYVYTDQSGELLIDNRYCAFNQIAKEYEMDEVVVGIFNEFNKQDDVILLRVNVDTKLAELLETDETLKTFQDVTLETAFKQWRSNYQAELDKKAAEEAAAKAAEEAAAAQAKAAEEAAAAAEAAAQAQAAAPQPALPPGGYAAGTQVTITSPEPVNVREGMSTETRGLTEVSTGGVVTVVADSDPAGWTLVTYNGVQGYIRTDVLK